MKERAIGHDEVEVDARDTTRRARNAFGQGVSHDLAAGPRVPAGTDGVRCPGQRCIDGHTLGDREQCGEVRHGVRRRTEADRTFRSCTAGSLCHRPRVTTICGGFCGGDDGLVSGPIEGPGVRGEFLVHRCPVLNGQAGCFLHEQRGPPLVQLARLQRCHGSRHLRDKRFGKAKESGSFIR
ncbi:hypothetical protein D3C73_1275150 [compost metagenome]